MNRDLIGYGQHPPDPRWPGGARIAVQFVVNYEEGAENCVLNGDKGSEAFLSDMVGAASHPARAMAMESLYEYGSRAGFWRLHRLFTERGLPVTIFGVANAMATGAISAVPAILPGPMVVTNVVKIKMIKGTIAVLPLQIRTE